ncbi:hypothetical protein GCM10028805_41210 [Spirosoma harenae]
MKSIIDALDFRELGVFNSREIGYFICGVSFLIYCFRINEIRASIKSLIKAIFAIQLVSIYALTIIYSIIPKLFYEI